MKAAYLAAILPDEFAPLTRASSDPRIERLARTFNLDLRDPATLGELLTLAQRHVDSFPWVITSQRQILAQELARDQSRFVRDAIRTYVKIAAMT